MRRFSTSSCRTPSIEKTLLLTTTFFQGELSCITPPTAGIASLRHELEIPEAARPGDMLTLSITPIDLEPSKSKPDRGLLTLAGELQTQAGKMVLKFRSLMLIYRRSLRIQNGNPL